MAHRFPIAEIIESWVGNYTVQAEVVLSKYHYHQIRMKGLRGSSTRGWRRPRGEASRHTFLTPSSVSMSPPCSHLHGSALHHTDTNKGGGARSPRHNHSSVRDKAYDEMIPQSSKQINKGTTQNGKYAWCRAHIGQLHQEVHCFLW